MGQVQSLLMALLTRSSRDSLVPRSRTHCLSALAVSFNVSTAHPVGASIVTYYKSTGRVLGKVISQQHYASGCACQSAEADNVTRMQTGKHSQAHSHPFGVAINNNHSEKGLLRRRLLMLVDEGDG